MADPKDNPAAGSPATRDMVERIRVLVARNTRRWKRLLLVEAAGLAVGVPLLYLWLAFILDNLVHLSRFGRLAACGVFLIGAGALVVSLARRWQRFQLGEDQVALAMERRTAGGVQNRLINAIQLARPRSAPRHTADADEEELSQAVIQENYHCLEQIHLEQAAEIRPALVRVALAGIAVVAGVVFYGVERANFTNAAQRILMPLSNVAPLYRTTLEIDPGDTEASGDVPITVKIKGTPCTLLTFIRSAGGISSSESVSVPRGEDSVTYVMRGVSQTTTYAVQGNDYFSPYFRIEVPAIPNLSLVRFVYHFPDYTRLADRPGESATGDLEALVGTRAKLTFVLDQAAPEATLLVRSTGAPPE